MKIYKSVTIGIPTFNESRNIVRLLRQLSNQNYKNFVVSKILISDDASSDSTIKAIKQYSKWNESVYIFINKNRRGIARGLNQIISNTNTDILITLDADIKIEDKNFLGNLIEPIILNHADLTSSSIKEAHINNYYQKVLSISMTIKNFVFDTYRNGNNLYSCHGLARAYSRRMYKQIKFPSSIGNDMYSYLWCIKNKMNYIYTPKAQAVYKLPSEFKDHMKQSIRFYNSFGEQQKYFKKSLINRESKIPFNFILKHGYEIIKEIFSHPIEVLFYMCIQIITKIMSINYKSSQTWDISSSTK